MASTATATATATERKSKTTGFAVCCPKCGATADDDGEGGLEVRLADLSVHCLGCDEDVSRDDLQRLVDDAQRLIRWLDAAATV